MEEEIDIKELILMLWKKKIFIIVVTLICALILGIYSIFSSSTIQKIQEKNNAKPLYYADTTFVVGTMNSSETTVTESNTSSNIPVTVTKGQTRITQNAEFFNTYAALIKSKTSLNSIIKELDIKDIDANELANLISVVPVPTSYFVSVSVAYYDEAKVVLIAEKLMDEFVKKMEKTYSTDSVTIVDEPYLLSNSDIANSVSAAEFSTPSSIASEAIKSNIKYVIIGAFLGAVVSVGYILFKDMFWDEPKK